MSRIGRKPIVLPKGLDLKLGADNEVTVKGPKGTLSRKLPATMVLEQKDGQLVVNRPDESNQSRALHGLTRTLLDNMIKGVTEGYRRELEIKGVGYRALKDGNDLVVLLGFSHATKIQPPTGISFEVASPTKIAIVGIDKEQVGQQAARVRALRPPEPYKGKGVSYAGEVIHRKAGKAGKASKK
jgi:large subunit ribosomal protein L6